MAATIFGYAGSRTSSDWGPFGLGRALPFAQGGEVSDLDTLLIRDAGGTKGYREEGFVPAGYASLATA